VYTDPQSAAMAWAKENGWDAEAQQLDGEPVLAFFFTTPATGRKKEPKKHVAHYGSWVSFASGLMASRKVFKTDAGWQIAPPPPERRLT
jgi:hypothetical protein